MFNDIPVVVFARECVVGVCVLIFVLKFEIATGFAMVFHECTKSCKNFHFIAVCLSHLLAKLRELGVCKLLFVYACITFKVLL